MAWAILLFGCGASSATIREGEARPWAARPATERVVCTPAPRCERSASVRLVLSGEWSAPDVRFDGADVDRAELALGVCAAPGPHTIEVLGPAHTLSAAIVAEDGLEIVVALEDGELRATSHVRDLDAFVAAAGAIELPPAEAGVEGLRSTLTVLRDRVGRVRAHAEETRDILIRTTADELLGRIDALASATAEVDLAMLRSATLDEVRAAGAMYAIEHLCDVWAPASTEGLSALTIEVRPIPSVRFRFERVRVAIDGVEVLDASTFERAPFASGLVPPGEHAVVVEALLRGGAAPFATVSGFRVRVERPFTVDHVGARMVVRLGDRGGIAMAPTAIDVLEADVDVTPLLPR